MLDRFLHKSHLEILNVLESGTMAQLATAIEAVLGPSQSSHLDGAASITSVSNGHLPQKAYFLEEVCLVCI